MKRQIIKIDEDKCTGCGLCVPDCPEGALQIIDGKAKLVGELLCDGLGACIGNCPEGAIEVETREAEEYQEKKVMENIVKAGDATLRAHLKHLRDHNQDEYLAQALEYMKENDIEEPETKKNEPLVCGCPGIMMKDLRKKEPEPPKTQDVLAASLKSELGQWPIQLQLLNPAAPYFKDADLLIAADCVAFSFANFHQRFLKGKILIMFCPKLDTTMDAYLEKLTFIISNNNIKSITSVRMEVPCCYGTLALVENALKQSGKNITVKDYTISISGEII
ncbi:MAG: 4Fe-4S binding protein [Candidatus Zapsychrus exili]|nr:4Fe-4S binding protein [Candidatus Zapsychrus exili]